MKKKLLNVLPDIITYVVICSLVILTSEYSNRYQEYINIAGPTMLFVTWIWIRNMRMEDKLEKIEKLLSDKKEV